ncbi:MAG: lytic transglycosylase domain-containing protein [Clostridiales bacterium]|nr:lytic transglycosylase domain-containing protein [Clostridiales bacterium]
MKKYSKEMNVDKFLIYSIIKVESNFKEKSISRSGAKGLMQIMNATAKECANKVGIKIVLPDDLFSADLNIRLGTFYIKNLLKKYNDNLPIALAAYNAGIGNVNSWFGKDIGNINFNKIINRVRFFQTKTYIKKVIFYYKKYKNIYKE